MVLKHLSRSPKDSNLFKSKYCAKETPISSEFSKMEPNAQVQIDKMFAEKHCSEPQCPKVLVIP